MKRGNDLAVGLTVIGAIVATTLSVAWVKQSDVGRTQRDVAAHFRDVGNARVGNAVVVRGVVGGRIQAIELAPGGWVNVRLKLDPSVRLPSDPVVLLNESSLFGDWQATVVERSALPADAKVRAEVAEASSEPGMLPGTSLPGIGELTAVAGQIAGDVATVATRFGTAFDDVAARELHESIRNVSDLSSTLRTVANAHASDLDSLSRQLQRTVVTLDRAASSVELTAKRVDSAATSDDARRLIDNFSVASLELRHTATQIRGLSSRLEATEAKLDALLASGDSVLTKVNRGQGTLGLLVNDPSIYRRTDSVLTELRALVTDLRNNPKKYISVRLF
jgi:phospholipid/cholesterol/gamma-HCH transport system substrate-binding protein